ncbi:hypothetical protein T12_14101 [Trichinella patagoniensis]|uniref:Uncharacterized protein n=1 Tax=Trichinella patagoniensis TaxID=990121 RepID=A0A0V0Z6J8_9BILA|nr:hypothetical protein T12_9833 [Trichinella patagoniensis]KRY10349.1 hypothetical protein T12_11712 [Trichinella patagoniensis]KRY10788.1 hypothetical protein T12_11092 [Trichinella patagoniensis]KRY14580.1 hypothetical protein T12_16746 [Trichinella patagoniensis]KRY16184.1 hypothetical protein T12_14101 [Trichinella patagoniensis]
MSGNCDIEPDAALGVAARSDCSKLRTTCRRNSRWLSGLSSTKQCIRQAATVATFTALINKGQYHFLLLIVGRYAAASLSRRSTPPIPVLYDLTMFGTFTSMRWPFTLRCVLRSGLWVMKLLAILTMELSCHFAIYTFPSLRKSNAPRFCFMSSLSGNITASAPLLRYGRIVPMALIFNSDNITSRS